MQHHASTTDPAGTYVGLTYVGIDVGKEHLDVFARVQSGPKEQTRKHRFPNTAKGHRALARWIGREPARVALEASGRYSIDVSAALCEVETLALMVVNPRAAKQFGDSMMRRSKTDEIDADLLASYAQRMPFEAYEPPEAVFVELRAITRRIQALTVERAREKNRLQSERASRTASPVVTGDIEVNIRHLTRRIERLEQHALALLDDSDALREAFDHLVSIRGVGAKSAVLLLGELGMMPSDMTVREWVAFAGLDPKQHRSGTSVEKRARISKVGNARIRRALYMPALVAVRYEPQVKAYYEELIGRGKPPKVALTAVMRKLLHAIYGMLKHGQDFEGEKFYRGPEKAAAVA
jgi:transposase